MAGIYNINSTYNLNTRKIINKLSFELNQEFSAKVVDIDTLKNEVLLKMLDGWQFQAELQNKPDNIPEGVLRFKVQGFEDGKLKIKILNQDKVSDRDISNLLKTLEEQNVEISKDDFTILDKMVKHSMPLTRENISEVKSIFDFKNKMNSTPEEVDNFIQKFLDSKGIDPKSEKGIQYTDKLKGFFEAFKNVTENDILTLMENDVEINHKNINSFSRVFKEPQMVYKQLESFSKELNSINLQNLVQAESGKTELVKGNGENAETLTVYNAGEEPIEKAREKINIQPQKAEEIMADKKVPVKNLDSDIKSTVIFKEISEKPEKLNDIKILSDVIKEEIKSSSDKVKYAVLDIISNIKDGEKSTKDVISNFLQNSGNDFKVLNTVSNQYYYFDLPLRLEDHDYGCKLIIKDDRKKGKKIDTNDVKIAATINTENMGTVDSYLTIKNYNMTVEIKSEEKFMKILNSAKEILLNELSNLGYNISVKVDKRSQPVSLSDSREFFQDNDLVNINVRV